MPGPPYCAYHSTIQPGFGQGALLYTLNPWVPAGCQSQAGDPNANPQFDNEASGYFHEVVEAMTDPTNSTGWVYNVYVGDELGDSCAGT
jgi:hypothetical protein